MRVGAGKKFGFMPCESSASARGSYISRHLFQRPLIDDQGAFLIVDYALAATLDAIQVVDFDHLVPDQLQVTILAALMPIVTGEGGNAGTQSMTVVVRSLALREVEPKDTPYTLWREFRVGALDGLVIGTLVGIVVGAVTDNWPLGIVIGLAMLGNMIVAGTFGTLVPMFLRAINVDPALASSIFVTTATDCFGFLLFLGLATMFLGYLT